MLAIYCRTSKESETSIEQQKKLGIQFALSNKLEYEVYIDEGISGFKISDDEIDPFNNRPSFTSLINDIKNKKITKVWIYEHSRLSRNQYASAMIFNVFEKFNIQLFENGKTLDINDPQFQMFRGILSAISQYERHLIVNRTTRGIQNAINKGTRGYAKFYGYEKDGRNENGRANWKPIQSQLNIIKYAYEKVLEGKNYHSITTELFNKKILKDTSSVYKMKMMLPRFLEHFEYTGFTFNKEGKTIWKKIINCEDIKPNILNDKKYYSKSIAYTESLVSIENWFKVFEKLIITKTNDRIKKAKCKNKAGASIGTGLIKCSNCNMFYYTKIHRNHYLKEYFYYMHFISANTKNCLQRPKSIDKSLIDEIFKIFYFYNYYIFNDEEVLKLSLFQINQEITVVKEDIENTDKQISKIEKNIIKFNKTIDDTEDTETIKILAKRISDDELKSDELLKIKSSLIAKLDELSKKYSGTELERIYYNVNDIILNFFNNMSIEEQRTSIIKCLKNCLIFKNYLLFDTGYNIFIFDITKNLKFDISLLDNLKYGEIIKWYFLNQPMNKKFTDWMIENDKIKENERKKFLIIYNKILKPTKDILIWAQNVKKRKKIIENWFNELNIKYDDYLNRENVIFFIESKK